MTPTATLRAALEKHGINYDHGEFDYIDHPYSLTEPAILEAMEAYRGEAVDKLIAWADDLSALAIQLKSELAALKNSSAGKEK